MTTNNSSNNQTAASGKVLQGQGIGTASDFSTATYPSSTTVNQILYSSSSNTVSGLATANNGALITSAGGVPSIGTVPIAAGGTNATSMSTSTGIVKYDGTSLVTSSTAKIDSSNRYTNTSQPLFYAFNTSTDTNVTGDGTSYTILFDSAVINQGSHYNTGTGIFTAPVAGFYSFSANVLVGDIGTHNECILFFTGNVNQTRASNCNPSAMKTGGNQLSVGGSFFINMAANDTMKIVLYVAGSTKTVDVQGDASQLNAFTQFSGILLS